MPTVDTLNPDTLDEYLSEIQTDLACRDCESEVRVTTGVKLIRARVIHDAECAWWLRYQRREVVGAIPCCTVVTHRGPYKRDPATGEAA